MKRYISLVLIVLMLLPSAALAQPKISLPQKEEVVYGKMTPSGMVEEVFIVNAFLKQGKELFDYGNYSEVLNLTDTGVLRQGFTEVYIQTDAKDFFYQGKVRNNLMPWLVTFSYELDGVPVSPEALKGQSGQLKIHVKVRKNEEVDPVFFDNYMLQISMNLDQKYFSGIESEGATIASAGETKVVNLMSLPGKETDFVVKTRASNAHLGQIQVVGLPFELFMELPDIDQYTDDLVKLQDAIAMIASGVSEYVGGVGQLSDAAGQLEMGVGELYSNIGVIKKGMEELHEGRKQFDEGLKDYSTGMQIFKAGMDELIGGIGFFASSIDTLREGSKGLADGLATLSEKGDELVGGSEMILAGFEAMDALLSLPISQADMAMLLGILQSFSAAFDRFISELSPEELEELRENIYFLATRLEESIIQIEAIADALDASLLLPELDTGSFSNTKLEAAVAFIKHVQEERQKLIAQTVELRKIHGALAALDTPLTALIEACEKMASQYDQIKAMISRINDAIQKITPEEIEEYADNLRLFSASYRQFHEGLELYIDGVKQVSVGMNRLDQEGIAKLQEGAKKFSDESSQITSGVNDLAEGSQTLSSSHGQLLEGDQALIDGIGQYADGVGQLSGGLRGFAQGVKELAGGGEQLKSGASTLRNETSNMDEQMKAKIEEAMGDYVPGEYTLQSFADARNTGIQKVQFIYLSEAQTEEEVAESEGEEEPPKSLWDKFLDLFR
jgi:putative membrane protein